MPGRNAEYVLYVFVGVRGRSLTFLFTLLMQEICQKVIKIAVYYI
jgi:hypothetical protein